MARPSYYENFDELIRDLLPNFVDRWAQLCGRDLKITAPAPPEPKAPPAEFVYDESDYDPEGLEAAFTKLEKQCQRSLNSPAYRD